MAFDVHWSEATTRAAKHQPITRFGGCTKWVILTMAQIRVRSKRQRVLLFWCCHECLMAHLVHHQKPLSAPTHFVASCASIMPMRVLQSGPFFFLHTCWLKECAMANRGRLVARHFYELATRFWMDEAAHFILLIHLCVAHVSCLTERKRKVIVNKRQRCHAIEGICDFSMQFLIFQW
jgi:hypothetical protein